MKVKTTVGPQKTVLKTQLFKVVETEITYPTGKKATRNDLYRNPSVFIFPLTEKNELYLIHQYRYLLGRIATEAVAGHIEQSESSVVAARRELKEEAGIDAHVLEQIAKLDESGSVVNQTIYCFLAKDLIIEKQKLEEDEEIEVVKIPLVKAVDMVLTGEIKDTVTGFGILLLNDLKHKKRL